MKNILNSTLLFILCFILMYLMVAFCESELNFQLWEESSRWICVFVTTLVSSQVICGYLTDKNKKS